MASAARPLASDRAWAVFVNFDGTITDRDTFDVLVQHFAGPEVWARTGLGLNDGTLTLRDVLDRQVAYVRAPFDEVAALLRREVRIDPTFPPFVRACRRRGIALTVLSSGIARVITGRLADVGCGDVPVVANDVEAHVTGWKICFRDPVPNGTDKAAFVRHARESGSRTVFIGDGHSDFAAALEADRCFAKAGLPLESYLRAQGVAFDVFETFTEVERALDADDRRSDG